MKFVKTRKASRSKNHLLKSSRCLLIKFDIQQSLRQRGSRNHLFQAFGQSSCILFLEVCLGSMVVQTLSTRIGLRHVHYFHRETKCFRSRRSIVAWLSIVFHQSQASWVFEFEILGSDHPTTLPWNKWTSSYGYDSKKRYFFALKLSSLITFWTKHLSDPLGNCRNTC